jgi:hypothetical protein
VPVVVAGGPQMDNERELLQMVRDSIDAGERRHRDRQEHISSQGSNQLS